MAATEFHRFLDLPLELRQMIYRQVLLDNPIEYRYAPDLRFRFRTEVKYVNGQEQSVEITRLNHPHCRIEQPKSKHGMILANRRISQEFIQWAHFDVTFDFHIGEQSTAFWKYWMISRNTLSRIRHVQFTHDYNTARRWSMGGSAVEIYFPFLIDACPRLKSVYVRVIAKNSWLKDREGDEVIPRSQTWEVISGDWDGSWII